MARVTHAAFHLPIAEVQNRMRTDPRPDRRQRWFIIYNALVELRAATEIARHCGVSKATVHAVISRYNRLGVAAIEPPGKGGRRRHYRTLEEETAFLAPFFAQAQRGEIATVGQIWRAFEQRGGHTVNDSTIYRLLHRHGWRKLMPRPQHPKANEQVQEQFKNFAAQVEAAVAAQEAGDERKGDHHGARRRLFWPHQSHQMLLGTTWGASSCPYTGGARAPLCLCSSSSSFGPDGLAGFARSLHGEDESTLEEVSRVFSTHFIVMQVDGAGIGRTIWFSRRISV